VASGLREENFGFIANAAGRVTIVTVMELRHLRYFVAVAEELNFTRAAAKLHLAQPSLTRQVQNLEAELGVRLLDRSRNQVVLTQEGRSFLADARRILDLTTESILAVQRLSRGEDGTLNIAYLPSFDFELLPETLQTFRRAFPHVGLNLFDMNPAEQLQAIEAGTIDLGYVGLPLSRANNGLQGESIARHRIMVVLPTKHPLAGKRQIELRELEPMFFVGMSEKTNPGFRDWLHRTCQSAGFTPRVIQDAEAEPTLMSFIAEGLGITLAREHLKKLPNPGVSFRPLAPPLKTDYCVAWHRNNNSRALQQYLQVIKGGRTRGS
jgi:DNA-binding transcriptional LysR family regulator